HVIDEDAARSTRIYWPQDEEVGFVLHHPVGVSRCLVEICDDAVPRGCRIDFALGDAFDSKIGAGFAKSLPVGETLHRIDLDLNNSHDQIASAMRRPRLCQRAILLASALSGLLATALSKARSAFDGRSRRHRLSCRCRACAPRRSLPASGRP